MSGWTDEQKQEVIAQYVEEINQYESDEEKGKHSVEIVESLADEFEKTTNGVRTILHRAGVYVKKTPTAKKASTSTGGKRVNKAEAQQELRNAIATIDADLVNDEIIDKLTGKAAQYLTEVVHKALTVGE